MSSPSETGGQLSRFDPRRLISDLSEFTRKMRRTPKNVLDSDRSSENYFEDIIWDDDFDLSPPTPLDRGCDKQTTNCDLCFNKQRQQYEHSLESTDSASSDDYHTAPLPPDDVEITLETRDSIECLLETLQTQHGGKVPRWARRAVRNVNQRSTDDLKWLLEDEENGQKRSLPLEHETTVEFDQPPLDARAFGNNGSKVASLRRLFEH